MCNVNSRHHFDAWTLEIILLAKSEPMKSQPSKVLYKQTDSTVNNRNLYTRYYCRSHSHPPISLPFHHLTHRAPTELATKRLGSPSITWITKWIFAQLLISIYQIKIAYYLNTFEGFDPKHRRQYFDSLSRAFRFAPLLQNSFRSCFNWKWSRSDYTRSEQFHEMCMRQNIVTEPLSLWIRAQKSKAKKKQKYLISNSLTTEWLLLVLNNL